LSERQSSSSTVLEISSKSNTWGLAWNGFRSWQLCLYKRKFKKICIVFKKSKGLHNSLCCVIWFNTVTYFEHVR
jgi:hypothetical protein